MSKFKKSNLIYLGITAAVLFFTCALIPALRPVSFSILNFPLKLFMSLGREASGIIFYHRNLVQNEKFKIQADLIKYNRNEMKEISLENLRLKELLSFKQKSPYKVIVSRVIGRSADNWSSLVIVDKGETAGIKKGFVVINHVGLVGRVIETTRSTSKIMLINNPNFGVSCLVQRSRQEGLVTGTLSNSLVMKYLPGDSDVVAADTVVTSGLTEAYPKGLLIGTVIEVRDEFSGLSRYCLIKPTVDLSSLEEALIIIP